MKTIYFSLLTIIMVTYSNAQSNNPYSQRGVDFVSSFNLIKADYNAGKIKALNESVLNYYSKTIPLKNSISMELASEIVKTAKNPPYALDAMLKNSSLSPYARQTLSTLIKNPDKLNDNSLLSFLEKKNEEITSANLLAGEKEALLTLSAISYAIHSSGQLRNGDGGCAAQTEDGTTGLSSGDCIMASAGMGFVIGFNACGIWCALGGAVVFGVVTAIALS